MQFLAILMLVFAVLVATFAVQNAYPVTIYFLKWQFEASFALVILISLLIGAVAVGSLGLVHQATNRIKARNQVRGKEEKSVATGEVRTEKTGDPAKISPEASPEASLEAKEDVAGGVDDSPQEVEG
ncbi:MAG: LapA family protein [Firmicutes bacterium]|nr:LapA family protein [Bacillota bacterium]